MDIVGMGTWELFKSGVKYVVATVFQKGGRYVLMEFPSKRDKEIYLHDVIVANNKEALRRCEDYVADMEASADVE